MKTLFIILLLSVSLFSILEPSLFHITKYLIIFYTLIEISIYLLSNKTENTLKSKFFFANWISAGAPNAFFSIEIPVKKTEDLIKKYNLENPKKKIDIQLFCIRSIANSFINDKMHGNISFGNFTNIVDTVDVTVNKVYYQRGNHVYDEKEIHEMKKNDKKFNEEDFEKKEVFHVIKDCSNKKVTEFREDFEVQKKILLKEYDERKKNYENINKYLPGFLIKLGMDIYIFLSYSLGLNFKILGLEKRKFGKIYFCGPHRENILNDCLMPLSNKLQSLVCLSIKNIKTLPVVLENGDIGTDRIMEAFLNCDHRIADGSALLRVIPAAKKIFENPEEYL